jgi:hypothetical protein
MGEWGFFLALQAAIACAVWLGWSRIRAGQQAEDLEEEL